MEKPFKQIQELYDYSNEEHHSSQTDQINETELKDYLTVAVACIAIFSAIAGGIRWMVKHYLNELKPNGGSSVKDSIARLETKVEILYQIMIQEGKK